MTEVRSILCVCGEELAEAVLVREYWYVILGSDGSEFYRARLTCPSCSHVTWWRAEKIEVQRVLPAVIE
ncbi:MAG: hypothetical protein MUO37_06145 [Methyloceanibacter sp.]|nr:hypothetical protein [Methyloceanibacter sp.]